jgi:hypothetical protein
MRVRLLERYRRLRPELTTTAMESPSIRQVAAALTHREAAVLIGIGDDATVLVLLHADNAAAGVEWQVLSDWPWERWQRALAGSGWVDAVGGRPGAACASFTESRSRLVVGPSSIGNAAARG